MRPGRPAHHDQMRAPVAFLTGQVGNEGYGLDSLAQPHLHRGRGGVFNGIQTHMQPTTAIGEHREEREAEVEAQLRVRGRRYHGKART